MKASNTSFPQSSSKWSHPRLMNISRIINKNKNNSNIISNNINSIKIMMNSKFRIIRNNIIKIIKKINIKIIKKNSSMIIGLKYRKTRIYLDLMILMGSN